MSIVFESWLATEVFNVTIVPPYVVERFESWRQQVTNSIAVDGPQSHYVERKDEFVAIALECERLLGTAPPLWNQRTGCGGVDIPITMEWIDFIGLSPRTGGPVIQTSEVFEPVRIAIGLHHNRWYVGIKTMREVAVIMPVSVRGEVFKLCDALRITLPAPVIQPIDRSTIILP